MYLCLTVQSSDEILPPLPPKMADLDEEMMYSDLATKLQPKCGSEETLNYIELPPVSIIT